MSIEVVVKQNGTPVKVTKSGELVVGQLEYDDTFYNEMSSTGTAYNFFVPKAGKQFIITGFLAVSDKNITADAIVEIYEANSDTSTTVEKALPKFALTKNAVVSPTPLRILVTEGVWVNAKTDDATIHLTMFGYYIKV
jgi:hypothetical protein